MKPMIIPAKALLISTVTLLLAGCFYTSKEAVLPQTGPTMKEVYDGHFQGNGEGSRNGAALATDGRKTASPMGRARRFGDDVTDLNGYTREAYNETRLVFERLPNPDLVMYVFPHLAGPEGNPIPGYSTAFPFYEKVHYALPGEVEEH